jgi:putative phosphoesterase
VVRDQRGSLLDWRLLRMKIGIISDTHNYFDPRIATLFAGVEHVLHAGDIGLPRILSQLEQIAPVTAVSGNTDEPGFGYRETEQLELAGRKFLLHHIVDPLRFADGLPSDKTAERPDIVVFGHTHKPYHEFLGKTLFFNPGYAGKSRFGMERTIAILHCDKHSVRWEYFPL